MFIYIFLLFVFISIFTPSKKGPVAEWLGSALQKLLQQFESARDLEPNPDNITLSGFVLKINHLIA